MAPQKSANETIPAYLPNITTLRAIAALMVVVCHIELRKTGDIRAYPIVSSWGGIGVNIFFVLSGFLITFLLLQEKNATSHIHIKKFYLRRILRIWPLYFALLALAYSLLKFIIAGNSGSPQYGAVSLLLNVFFLTNVTFITSLTPLFISPIWSIGVEEQFYIFWPWLLKWRRLDFCYSMIAVVVLISLLKLLFAVLYIHYDKAAFHFVSQLITTSRFDLMALGGLFAYVGIYKKVKLLNWTLSTEMLQTTLVQVVALFLFLISVGLSMAAIQIDLMINVASYCSALLIFNLALNNNSIIKLESKTGDFIGQISYGIYLLHMPVIYLTNKYLLPNLMQLHLPAITLNICLYSLVLSMSILLASMSYYYYEKPFLQLKERLSKF